MKVPPESRKRSGVAFSGPLNGSLFLSFSPYMSESIPADMTQLWILFSLIPVAWGIWIYSKAKYQSQQLIISNLESDSNALKDKLLEQNLKVTQLSANLKIKNETERALLAKVSAMKRKRINNSDEVYHLILMEIRNLLSIDEKIASVVSDDIHYTDSVSHFRESLKSKFPELKEIELNLCCLVILNLSAKEISQVLRVSSGYIRVLKSKIKQKLVKDQDISLIDFLKASLPS